MNPTIQFRMFINGELAATFETGARHAKKIKPAIARNNAPLGKVTFSRNKFISAQPPQRIDLSRS